MTPRCRAPDRRIEGGAPDEILAAGERHRRALAERTPGFGRRVDAKRFLQPAKSARRNVIDEAQGLIEVPSLVCVGRKPLVRRKVFRRFPGPPRIFVEIEPDLDLEVAKARRAAFRNHAVGDADIDAACVGSNLSGARRREERVQRLRRASREEIPKRRIETGDYLCIGSRLAGLQRLDLDAFGYEREELRRAREGLSEDEIGEVFGQEPDAVLRRAGRPVAPDLAPPERALAVRHLDEQAGPIAHGPEGCRHWDPKRRAVDERLDPLDRGPLQARLSAPIGLGLRHIDSRYSNLYHL